MNTNGYVTMPVWELAPRSEQVNGAVANEIKHDHSHSCFRPQVRFIILVRI